MDTGNKGMVAGKGDDCSHWIYTQEKEDRERGQIVKSQSHPQWHIFFSNMSSKDSITFPNCTGIWVANSNTWARGKHFIFRACNGLHNLLRILLHKSFDTHLLMKISFRFRVIITCIIIIYYMNCFTFGHCGLFQLVSIYLWYFSTSKYWVCSVSYVFVFENFIL